MVHCYMTNFIYIGALGRVAPKGQKNPNFTIFHEESKCVEISFLARVHRT